MMLIKIQFLIVSVICLLGLMFVPAKAQTSASFENGIKIGGPSGECVAGVLGAVKYTTADGLIYCDGTTWLKVSDGTDLGAGTGTLQIGADFSDGGVIIGSTTTCDGAAEGTVRYISGNGVRYCDDTSTWQSASGPAPPSKKVFVAGEYGNSNFLSVALGLGYVGGDGMAAADYICADEATNASLSGTFLAWVSSSAANDPESRFTQSTSPYLMPDGGNTQVADNWTDLTDGSLDAAITFKADGTSLGANYPSTNVNHDGTFISSTLHCNGWTTSSSGVGAIYGQSGTGSTWSDTNSGGCNVSQVALLCFEQ